MPCLVSLSLSFSGVYKLRQALIAQAAGANYVAPYLGRMADGIKATYPVQSPEAADMEPEEYEQALSRAAMESAMEAVASMQAAATNTGSEMRVLVASIRDASDMAELAARVSRSADNSSCLWCVLNLTECLPLSCASEC